MNEQKLIDAQHAYKERHAAEKLMETSNFTIHKETYTHNKELFGMLPGHDYEIIGERYFRNETKSMMLYDIRTEVGVAKNIPSCYFTPLEPKLRYGDEFGLIEDDFDLREIHKDMISKGEITETELETVLPRRNTCGLTDLKDEVIKVKRKIINELSKTVMGNDVPDILVLSGMDYLKKNQNNYQDALIQTLSFINDMECEIRNYMAKL